MRHPDITILTAPPPNPVSQCTVQVVGGPGGVATYFYWIVAHYPIGSIVSQAFVVRGAPKPTDAQHYVIVSWAPEIAATAYDVLRTPTDQLPPDGSNFALALGLTSPLFLDQGQTLQPYSIGGLPHMAPVDGWAHMNNRDYSEPVLELWPTVHLTKILFPDGSSQSSAGGGGGGAAGDNGQIQFNDNGVFGASPNLIFNGSNLGVQIPVASFFGPIMGIDSRNGLFVQGGSQPFPNANLPAGVWITYNAFQNLGTIQAFDFSGNLGNTQLEIRGKPLLLAGASSGTPEPDLKSAVWVTNVGFTAFPYTPAFNSNDQNLIIQNSINTIGLNPAYLTLFGNSPAGMGAVGAVAFANLLSWLDGPPDSRIAIISGGSDTTVDSGYLAFTTYNAGVPGERMRLTAAGNVGIGTTTPQSPLVVEGNSSLEMIEIRNGNTDSTTGFRMLALTSAFGQLFMGFGNGAGYWLNSPSFPLSLRTSSVDRLYIDNNGNVGIGTTTPQAMLHVAGLTRIGPNSFSGALFQVDGTLAASGFIYAYGGIVVPTNLPSADPGSGSKQLWYDPSDGNRVKFSP